MSIQLDPYLFFKGNAREAIDFYKNVFGGDVEISTFGESPGDFAAKDEMKDQVMHGLLSGGAVRLMVSDSTMASEKAAKIELALSGDDEIKLKEIFDKLSEGGKVKVPLEKAPWGDTFGQLTDKYNFDWMVNITTTKP